MAKTDYYYGVHAVETVLELEPERVLTLFVLKERDDHRLKKILQLAEPFGISVQKAGRDRLEKLAGQPFHQGIVAAVRAYPSLNEDDLMQLVDEDKELVLLALDQVTDPHNLGACIRTAAAMGVKAVIVPRDRSATLTPVVRKVAAGGADKVKFIQVTNLGKTLAALKQHQVNIIGTILDPEAIPIHTADLGGRIALVMGAEESGIRPINQAQCDQMVYIPMQGQLQSLNVSVATGMALYEIFRQRLV